MKKIIITENKGKFYITYISDGVEVHIDSKIIKANKVKFAGSLASIILGTSICMK